MNKSVLTFLYLIVIGTALGGYFLIENGRKHFSPSAILLMILALAAISIFVQLSALMKAHPPLNKWKWISLSSGLLVGGLAVLYLLLLK
jgi:heme/copper-type cytochrome/quinol oxidase subunit 4